MNCQESLKRLYEFLDGALGDLPKGEIEQHIERCRHCWNRFDFEKQLKEMIHKSCSKERCSETLKSRIQSLLEKY